MPSDKMKASKLNLSSLTAKGVPKVLAKGLFEIHRDRVEKCEKWVELYSDRLTFAKQSPDSRAPFPPEYVLNICDLEDVEPLERDGFELKLKNREVLVLRGPKPNRQGELDFWFEQFVQLFTARDSPTSGDRPAAGSELTASTDGMRSLRSEASQKSRASEISRPTQKSQHSKQSRESEKVGAQASQKSRASDFSRPTQKSQHSKQSRESEKVGAQVPPPAGPSPAAPPAATPPTTMLVEESRVTKSVVTTNLVVSKEHFKSVRRAGEDPEEHLERESYEVNTREEEEAKTGKRSAGKPEAPQPASSTGKPEAPCAAPSPAKLSDSPDQPQMRTETSPPSVPSRSDAPMEAGTPTRPKATKQLSTRFADDEPSTESYLSPKDPDASTARRAVKANTAPPSAAQVGNTVSDDGSEGEDLPNLGAAPPETMAAPDEMVCAANPMAEETDEGEDSETKAKKALTEILQKEGQMSIGRLAMQAKWGKGELMDMPCSCREFVKKHPEVFETQNSLVSLKGMKQKSEPAVSDVVSRLARLEHDVKASASDEEPNAKTAAGARRRSSILEEQLKQLQQDHHEAKLKHKADISDAQEKADDLEDLLRETKHDHDVASSKRKAALAALRWRIAYLEEKINRTGSTLSEGQRRDALSQEAMKSAAQRMADLAADLDKCKGDHSKSMAEKDKALSDALKQVEKLQDEMESLKAAQLKEAEERDEELREAQAREDDMAKKQSETVQQLNEGEALRQKMLKAIEERVAELEKDMRREVAKRKEAEARRRQAVQDKEEIVAAMKTAHEDELAKVRAKHEDALGEREEHIDDLTKQLNHHKNSLLKDKNLNSKSKEAQEARIKDLEEALAKKKAELAKCKAQRDEAESTIANLKNKVLTQAEAQTKELREEIVRLRTEHEETITEHETEVTKLREETVRVRTEHHQIVGQHEDRLKEKEDELHRVKKAHKEELGEQRVKTEQAQQEVTRVRADFDENDKLDAKRLREELAKTKKMHFEAISRAEARVARIEEEMHKAKQEHYKAEKMSRERHQEAEDRSANLEIDAKKHAKDAHNAREDHADAKVRIENLMEELKKTKLEHAELLDKYRVENSALKWRLALFLERMAAHRDEIGEGKRREAQSKKAMAEAAQKVSEMAEELRQYKLDEAKQACGRKSLKKPTGGSHASGPNDEDDLEIERADAEQELEDAVKSRNKNRMQKALLEAMRTGVDSKEIEKCMKAIKEEELLSVMEEAGHAKDCATLAAAVDEWHENDLDPEYIESFERILAGLRSRKKVPVTRDVTTKEKTTKESTTTKTKEKTVTKKTVVEEEVVVACSAAPPAEEDPVACCAPPPEPEAKAPNKKLSAGPKEVDATSQKSPRRWSVAGFSKGEPETPPKSVDLQKRSRASKSVNKNGLTSLTAQGVQPVLLRGTFHEGPVDGTSGQKQMLELYSDRLSFHQGSKDSMKAFPPHRVYKLDEIVQAEPFEGGLELKVASGVVHKLRGPQDGSLDDWLDKLTELMSAQEADAKPEASSKTPVPERSEATAKRSSQKSPSAVAAEADTDYEGEIHVSSEEDGDTTRGMGSIGRQRSESSRKRSFSESLALAVGTFSGEEALTVEDIVGTWTTKAGETRTVEADGQVLRDDDSKDFDIKETIVNDMPVLLTPEGWFLDAKQSIPGVTLVWAKPRQPQREWRNIDDPLGSSLKDADMKNFVANEKDVVVCAGMLGVSVQGKMTERYAVLYKDRLDSWEHAPCSKHQHPPTGRLLVQDLRDVELAGTGLLVVHKLRKLGIYTKTDQEAAAWVSGLRACIAAVNGERLDLFTRARTSFVEGLKDGSLKQVFQDVESRKAPIMRQEPTGACNEGCAPQVQSAPRSPW